MGAGQAQVATEQVADHRLGAGQPIHATALAVGLQGLTANVIGETGHHGNRGGAQGLEALAGAQQGIGLPQATPAHAAWPPAEAHLQGPVRRDDGANLQAQAGAAALGHLQVSQPQVRLDAGIEQQPEPLAPHRPQGQLASGKAIQGRALHVVNAWIAPIEGGPIHDIGVGHQAATGGRQQPGRRQAIAGIAADGTANPGGDHQQGGKRRGGRHRSITASRRSRPGPSPL